MNDTLQKLANLFKTDLKDREIEIANMNREDLALLFGKLGFKRGAEIGVEQGVYSEILFKAIPGLKLYGVDPWKAYKGYREHVSQEKLDGFLEATRKKLEDKYDFIVCRDFSVSASTAFKDESLDFVYIDGNHDYPNVVADLCAWTPKVRKGGIVAGHDYIKRKDPKSGAHVVQALQGFVDAYRISHYFIIGSKHPEKDEKRDSSRSWMFVKE